MKRLPKLFFALIIILLASEILARQSLPNFIERFDNIASNPNSVIRHFAPTWRSIKKVIDVPYILYGYRSVARLPVYEIELSKNDRLNLIQNLPNYPEENRLYEEFKNSVRASFRHDEYKIDNAKMRYRGNSPNHWNALKKSWHVQLPQNQPLNGRTELRFFIGEDKGWVKAFLWNHLGTKLNIPTLHAEPVWLRVNNKDMGAYVMIDGWENQGRIFTLKNLPAAGDRLRPEGIYAWYDREDPTLPGDSFPELVQLLDVTAKTSDTEFIKKIGTIIDIDAFLRWSALTTLTGDFHKQSNVDNLNFYYNKETKKFEPYFFDGAFAPIIQEIDVSEHRIINRLLAHQPWRGEFESMLRSYIFDENNLVDDLAFYDGMTEKFLPAIYRDTNKIQTSYEARKQITQERAVYEHNVKTLQKMFEQNDTLTIQFAQESYPLP